MGYSRLGAALTVRALALLAVLSLLAYALVETSWYAVEALAAAAALALIADLMRSLTRSNREIARFLDALTYDDTAQSFAAFARDAPYRELGATMDQVMARLRQGRSEREELARYLSTLIAHVPVALIARSEDGHYELLNPAARRLFDATGNALGDPLRFGEAFAGGLDRLAAGGRSLLKLERGGEALHLKAAATVYWAQGLRRTLISLQNIADDLGAQELAAWHSLIRTISHEVMNSLTPISSLSQTAGELVESARKELPADGAPAQVLADAAEALDAVARRSEGLLHFVQNHRRLTQRMSAQPQALRLARIVSRIERLLGPEMAARGIAFSARIEPAELEFSADPELIDQALINLLLNAMDAVAGRDGAAIALGATRGADGRVRLSIADNGPGIPAHLREQIFVPFYTTKQKGSGVGLTLVRQVASLHGGQITLADRDGGGTEFVLSF